MKRHYPEVQLQADGTAVWGARGHEIQLSSKNLAPWLSSPAQPFLAEATGRSQSSQPGQQLLLGSAQDWLAMTPGNSLLLSCGDILLCGLQACRKNTHRAQTTIPARDARSLTMQPAEGWKLVLYVLNVDFFSDRLGGFGHM